MKIICRENKYSGFLKDREEVTLINSSDSSDDDILDEIIKGVIPDNIINK